MTLPDAIRSAWAAANAPLEGAVPHFYLDIRNLVTIAVGNLCDPVGAALALPMRRADGTEASNDEIRADWQRVKAMPGGRVWTYYHSPAGLHLDADGIAALVVDRLDEDAEILNRRWPLAGLPAQAVAALCMLAWAVGAGTSGEGLTGPKWPHLQAAVDARDWAAAAVAGQLAWADNKGVRPRDLVVATLFWMASGLDKGAAIAHCGSFDYPQGPTDIAALKSLAAFDWSATDV